MSRLLKLTGEINGQHVNVIFVHGLGGDPYRTWQRSPNADSFWPLWLAMDVPGLAVFSVSYEAPVSRWRGTAMHLTDRATSLLERLLVEPDLRNGALILVGHSLGGLVIKQLLRTAESQAKNRGEARDLLSQVQKVAFLATPHAGSDLAAWSDRLRILIRPSASTGSLVRNDPNLRDLNGWYREWASSSGIGHLVLAETRSSKIFGMIVRPDSSDPGISGVRPVPIDADHVEICKPYDRSSDVYAHVRAFVERPIAPSASRPEERQNRSEQAIFQTINTPSGRSGGITNNITINMFGTEGIDKVKEFLREVGSYGGVAKRSQEDQE